MASSPPSCSQASDAGIPPDGTATAPDTPAPAVFGKKEFSKEELRNIRNLLQQRLGKEHLATRAGAGGAQLTYIEGWQTIQIANSIFGFNGWSSSVVEVAQDFIDEDKGKFRVGATALVRVTLRDGTSHEDVGYGLAENPRKGIAIENAKKEAVTDARKRALRLFGNALGNCIYDKGHLKRLKTAQKDAPGYLPSDTTMELMNRATNDGEGQAPAGQSNQNQAQPIYNGGTKSDYKPVFPSAPKQIVLPTKLHQTPARIAPQQQQQQPLQQQQQCQPLDQPDYYPQEGDYTAWNAEADDALFLAAAAAVDDNFAAPAQQPPPVAQGNYTGVKRPLA